MSAPKVPGNLESNKESKDFISEPLERYKRSVVQNMEEKATLESAGEVRSKKRGTPSFNLASEQSSKHAKIHGSDTGTEQGDASLGGDSETIDGTTELAKKRLASRVSSRRTREREKLRMDHFRSAKVKLLEDNKTLSDENQQLRSLIHKIRSEKALRDQNTAGVLSMLGSNNQGAAVPSMFAQAVPVPPQQQPQPDLSSLLINALAHNFTQQQHAPVVPSQEQQLLALLGLVANNPGLTHQLLGQLHPSHQQQQPILSQLIGQLQQQQPQQQHQPMNLVGALQGNVNFGRGVPNQSQTLQHNLLSLLLGQGAKPNI